MEHRHLGEVLPVAKDGADQTNTTRTVARADALVFMERFYHSIQCLSTLGYISPLEFKQAIASVRVKETDKSLSESSHNRQLPPPSMSLA